MKIMSVVTFKVKDGYQEEFTDAYRKAGSSSANFSRLVAVGEDTFVSINELPTLVSYVHHVSAMLRQCLSHMTFVSFQSR